MRDVTGIGMLLLSSICSGLGCDFDHSPKKPGQHPLVRSFDVVIGYRSSPICAWDNNDGQIPSLDPHPKVVIRSVFLDDRTRDGHQNASIFLLEVEKIVIQKT